MHRAESIDERGRLPDVPFRLLGFAADPDKASDLCGQTFARYAASGTDITLVCAAARDWSGADHTRAARQLGVRDLVLLDYRLTELTAAGLEDVFADVMASVRPHVVVADGSDAAVRDAATSAFSRIRRATGGERHGGDAGALCPGFPQSVGYWGAGAGPLHRAIGRDWPDRRAVRTSG